MLGYASHNGQSVHQYSKRAIECEGPYLPPQALIEGCEKSEPLCARGDFSEITKTKYAHECIIES